MRAAPVTPRRDDASPKTQSWGEESPRVEALLLAVEEEEKKAKLEQMKEEETPMPLEETTEDDAGMKVEVTTRRKLEEMVEQDAEKKDRIQVQPVVDANCASTAHSGASGETEVRGTTGKSKKKNRKLRNLVKPTDLDARNAKDEDREAQRKAAEIAEKAKRVEEEERAAEKAEEEEQAAAERRAAEIAGAAGNFGEDSEKLPGNQENEDGVPSVVADRTKEEEEEKWGAEVAQKEQEDKKNPAEREEDAAAANTTAEEQHLGAASAAHVCALNGQKEQEDQDSMKNADVSAEKSEHSCCEADELREQVDRPVPQVSEQQPQAPPPADSAIEACSNTYYYVKALLCIRASGHIYSNMQQYYYLYSSRNHRPLLIQRAVIRKTRAALRASYRLPLLLQSWRGKRRYLLET